MNGEDAVRAVLARLAADELPYLEPVLLAYRNDPWEPGGDSGADRPVGAGFPADQLAAWAPLVIAFVAQTLAAATLESAAKGLVTQVRSRWGGRSPRDGRAQSGGRSRWGGRGRGAGRRRLSQALGDPVPPLDPGEREHVRLLARRAAANRGRTPKEQEEFAAAILEVLQG